MPGATAGLVREYGIVCDVPRMASSGSIAYLAYDSASKYIDNPFRDCAARPVLARGRNYGPTRLSRFVVMARVRG